MIKIIASDMDGTLLNDKMQVSAGNAAAIKAAKAAGIEFMVATGRNISEAKPLLAEHDLNPAFIALNGARVYDESGVLKVDVPLDRDILPMIIETLASRHIYFELVTDKGVVSDNKVARIQNVADLLVNLNPDTTYKIAVALAAARLELMNITYVDDYGPILADPATEVMKIIAFAAQGQDVLGDPQRELEATGRLVVTSSSRTNIEINHINAQKGIALKAYAAQKGITMDEVMTVGDNLNDASMIAMAKYGVAMGNAIPQIKQMAWMTTAINTEDGVGKAIMKAIELNAAEK
ncbi:Cof-type HAD-IIB family hydrolase [Lacticaseibacillus absianus]|uniref:Cof-type HAD-IIB family hydrolase n=1 Tax=Lacticaseibacillus absianus TaxID=2729623 RepID=UPI0015CE7E98|nr:Cof-type HAD-IIB family hydrolase [Lacticaseibacillus absianus]